jgi:hypothetical protein
MNVIESFVQELNEHQMLLLPQPDQCWFRSVNWTPDGPLADPVIPKQVPVMVTVCVFAVENALTPPISGVQGTLGTVAVAADVAVCVPPPGSAVFSAVTTTWMVSPTSREPTAYVLPVAPGTGVHPVNALQSSH